MDFGLPLLHYLGEKYLCVGGVLLVKTKKQEELVNSFLSTLGDEIKPLYQDIINYLSDLGYVPKKEKENISFKHDLHNKQIAKMGMKKSKDSSSFIALRFSACNGYSQRFTDIVSVTIIKYPSRVAGCISSNCNYCAGEPATHVYSYTFPDGESRTHCGAYTLEIPDISADDMEEIMKLIKEEHEYLLEHETSRK